jgi:hypothetical protein
MKKIFFLLPALFIFSCKDYKEIIIKDASKDTLIEIQSGSETPATLVFKVSGNIDDTCKIMGVPIDENNLEKDISVDAYSKKLPLDYKAFNVKKGSIVIRYKY